MVWGWFKHITFTVHFISNLGFQGGSGVKNLPANAEDVGLMPGIGIVLVEERTTHSSILAWAIPRTEEPGGLQFMGP